MSRLEAASHGSDGQKRGHHAFSPMSARPRPAACCRATAVLMTTIALILSAATACAAPRAAAPTAPSGTPTPQTRAARTAAARGVPTLFAHLPTAVIYVNAAGTPVWPTPPSACVTTVATASHPDMGPTIGEAPIWMASAALPVVPWRNEFIRTRWLIDNGTPGDLAVSGRRLDGEGTVRFIRQGAEGMSEQLRIATAGVPRAARPGEEGRPYADYPVYLVLSSPGCWELNARMGEISRTMRIYVYS